MNQLETVTPVGQARIALTNVGERILTVVKREEETFVRGRKRGKEVRGKSSVGLQRGNW